MSWSLPVSRPAGVLPGEPARLFPDPGGSPSLSRAVAQQLAPDKGPIEGKDIFSSSDTQMSDAGSHRGSSRTPRRLPMTPSPSPRLSEVVDGELEKTNRKIRRLELQLQMSGYHKSRLSGTTSTAARTTHVVSGTIPTSGTGYMSGTVPTSGTGYVSGTIPTSGTAGTYHTTSGTGYPPTATTQTEPREPNMVDAMGGRFASSEVHRISQKYWLALDKFDGINMPLETFLAKLENCSRYNGWTDVDKLAHLQANLTGGAAQCLWDVGVENSCSLPHLLTLLRGRFGSEGQAEKFRAELRGRRRKVGETLQSLYQDIRRLMVLAFPGPTNITTEIVGRDSFLDALGDRSLALRIREREPATMEEALRMAVRFEAYGQAEDPDMYPESRQKPRLVRGSNTEVENESSKVTTDQMQALMARIEQVAQMVSQNCAATSSVHSHQTSQLNRETAISPEATGQKSSYRPSPDNRGPTRKDARRSG